MERNRLEGKFEILNFIFAGIAYFTILNTNTGNRFTYRVTKKVTSKGHLHFVSVLCGPDNAFNYMFLGTIFDDSIFRATTKKPEITKIRSFKAFDWFFHTVVRNQNLGPVEFWHEGRCGRCGRKLTTPESIKSGFGPVCSGIIE